MASPKRIKFDFWFFVLIVSIGAVVIFLVYPLWSLLETGFRNQRTGELTLDNFERFLTTPFFRRMFRNSLFVSTTATLVGTFVGVTLAYLTTALRYGAARP